MDRFLGINPSFPPSSSIPIAPVNLCSSAPVTDSQALTYISSYMDNFNDPFQTIQQSYSIPPKPPDRNYYSQQQFPNQFSVTQPYQPYSSIPPKPPNLFRTWDPYGHSSHLQPAESNYMASHPYPPPQPQYYDSRSSVPAEITEVKSPYYEASQQKEENCQSLRDDMRTLKDQMGLAFAQLKQQYSQYQNDSSSRYNYDTHHPSLHSLQLRRESIVESVLDNSLCNLVVGETDLSKESIPQTLACDVFDELSMCCNGKSVNDRESGNDVVDGYTLDDVIIVKSIQQQYVEFNAELDALFDEYIDEYYDDDNSYDGDGIMIEESSSNSRQHVEDMSSTSMPHIDYVDLEDNCSIAYQFLGGYICDVRYDQFEEYFNDIEGLNVAQLSNSYELDVKLICAPTMFDQVLAIDEHTKCVSIALDTPCCVAEVGQEFQIYENNQLPPKGISPKVLVKMTQPTETFCGTTVKDVVGNEPANFGDLVRRTVQGPTVIGLLKVMSYVLSTKEGRAGEKRVHIFDPGGGSLDVFFLLIGEESTSEVKVCFFDAVKVNKNFVSTFLAGILTIERKKLSHHWSLLDEMEIVQKKSAMYVANPLHLQWDPGICSFSEFLSDYGHYFWCKFSTYLACLILHLEFINRQKFSFYILGDKYDFRGGECHDP